MSKMSKVWIFTIGWCLMVCTVSAGNNGTKRNRTDDPLLDKNDYQLDFHRMELVRFDKRYMQFVNAVTYKYNRTCPLANLTMRLLINVGLDVETVSQVYRFASNEYRIFPIRFQLNFCQVWNKDIAGIKDMSKCGNFKSCAPSKGINYTICNWTPNTERLPPFVPNGEYKLQIEFLYRATELFVLDTYATISRPVLQFLSV